MNTGPLVVGLVIVLGSAAVYLLVLWLIDPYEREPLSDLGLTLAAGVVIAPLITRGVETALGIPSSLQPAAFAVFSAGPPNLWGAVVEEAAKAAVVLGAFTLFRREFDDTLDGLIYGAAVGAGFALAQSLLYLRTLASLGAAAQPAPGFLFSIFVAGLNQCFFTSLFGGSLGALREAGPRSGRRAILPLLGFAAAAIYHVGYTGLGYLAGTPPGEAAWAPWAGIAHRLVDWLGVIVLLLLVRWAWERERYVFGRTLGDEVATGTVTADELSFLTAGERGRRQWHAWRRAGWGYYVATRRLHQAQAELAFAKWRRLRGVPDDTDVDRLRDTIRRLRAAAGARG
ncbi:MAG TPA: PrsW family glutamic-type intramembrane protease [bacterium]|nr:PrsW family glutamic-type intramembrane protease [bacterium]